MAVDHSLARDHNEQILREVRANRLERRLRAGGEHGFTIRRAVGALRMGRRISRKGAEPEKA